MQNKAFIEQASDKLKPLALVIGNSDIGSLLAQTLENRGCEAFYSNHYPKFGKYHYIFQIGNIKFVKTAILQHLKTEGKFLFIDIANENVSEIKNESNIRILRLNNLESDNPHMLCEKILEVIFTQTPYSVIDLRKKSSSFPVAAFFQKPQQDEISVPQYHLIQKNIRRRWTVLALILVAVFVSAVWITTNYLKEINNNFTSFKTHMISSDWPSVKKDINIISDKLETGRNFYKLAEIILFPLRQTLLMKNLKEFLDDSSNLLQTTTEAVSFATELKNSNSGFAGGQLAFSREDYENVMILTDKLSYGASKVKSKIESIPKQWFYHEDLTIFLNQTLDSLAKVKKLLPVISQLFITDKPKTYLILFQNNMELRPTGGFIGSVGFLEVLQGKIVDFKIMDVYTIDGQLKGHVEPPVPIRKYLAQPNWFLRDSNFDPDFALTGYQAKWFLQKTIGKNVDGVIAVNLFFVQDILSSVGPVILSDFNNEEISSVNLFVKANTFIQKDFFPGSSQKKDFLTALSTSLQNKLTGSENLPWLQLLTTVKNSLDHKNILINVDDKSLQELLEKEGWAGRITEIRCLSESSDCLPDYLALNEANLGVNKANYFVSKSVAIEKMINDQGKIITDLTISYENKSLAQAFHGGSYVNYLRILVPTGSNLLSISLNNVSLTPDQVEISSYGVNKTVFATLLKIAQANRGVLKLSYSLPFNVDPNIRNYQFFYQKQPGDKSSPLILSIKQQNQIRLMPVNFNSTSSRDNEIYFTTDTSVDRIFSFKRTN